MSSATQLERDEWQEGRTLADSSRTVHGNGSRWTSLGLNNGGGRSSSRSLSPDRNDGGTEEEGREERRVVSSPSKFEKECEFTNSRPICLMRSAITFW